MNQRKFCDKIMNIQIQTKIFDETVSTDKDLEIDFKKLVNQVKSGKTPFYSQIDTLWNEFTNNLDASATIGMAIPGVEGVLILIVIGFIIYLVFRVRTAGAQLVMGGAMQAAQVKGAEALDFVDLGAIRDTEYFIKLYVTIIALMIAVLFLYESVIIVVKLMRVWRRYNIARNSTNAVNLMRERNAFPKYEIMLEFICPMPPKYEVLRVATIDVLPGRLIVRNRMLIGNITVGNSVVHIEWPEIQFLLDNREYPFIMATSFKTTREIARNIRFITSLPHQLRLCGGLCNVFYEICAPDLGAEIVNRKRDLDS